MCELGRGGERIGRRDGDAEREEREVEDGDVKGGRGEDESDVVFGDERVEGG